jgi:hypothetical protein
MRLQLRAARADHSVAIAEVWHAAWHDAHDDVVPPELLPPTWSAEQVAAFYRDPHNITLTRLLLQHALAARAVRSAEARA